MLPFQRGRQRAAATHRIAHVGERAPGDLVLGQFQQDRERAVQRLAGAEQRGQLLGELHQPFAREGFGFEQPLPHRLAAAFAGQPGLHRQVTLLLQALHHIGVAGGFHLAVKQIAAGVQGLVAVEGHQGRDSGLTHPP